MKHFLLISGLAAALSAPVFAQSANPLVAGQKGIYEMSMQNVMKSAEQVSEDLYSFKPVDTVRTFGQLVAHVADAQYEFCGPIVGDGNKGPGVEKTKTSKADIIAALKDAQGYCEKAYGMLDDTKATEMVKFFGPRKMAKLTVLSFNNAHNYEHYGNMVTYMRIKGMVPPSSQH